MNETPRLFQHGGIMETGRISDVASPSVLKDVDACLGSGTIGVRQRPPAFPALFLFCLCRASEMVTNDHGIPAEGMALAKAPDEPNLARLVNYQISGSVFHRQLEPPLICWSEESGAMRSAPNIESAPALFSRLWQLHARREMAKWRITAPSRPPILSARDILVVCRNRIG